MGRTQRLGALAVDRRFRPQSLRRAGAGCIHRLPVAAQCAARVRRESQAGGEVRRRERTQRRRRRVSVAGWLRLDQRGNAATRGTVSDRGPRTTMWTEVNRMNRRHSETMTAALAALIGAATLA